MLEKKGDDVCYTVASGRALSNNDLGELTISFDCWRESLPSLPELSRFKNDIIEYYVNINQVIIIFNFNIIQIQFQAIKRIKSFTIC